MSFLPAIISLERLLFVSLREVYGAPVFLPTE